MANVSEAVMEEEYDKYSQSALSKSISAAHAGEMARYTEKNLHAATPALKHALENSAKHGLPRIAVSPAQGKFLTLLMQISRTKNVLEVGTLGGYSAICFHEGVKARGGKVTSIEIDSKRRDVAAENLKYAGVKSPAETEVLLGSALEVLPKIAKDIEEGKREKFDFVFIDADWDNQWQYFDWGVKLSNGPGSVVYVDNVVRMLLETGAVGGGEKDMSVDNLIEKVGADTRVEATVLETVGSKNYDGFLMAVVK